MSCISLVVGQVNLSLTFLLVTFGVKNIASTSADCELSSNGMSRTNNTFICMNNNGRLKMVENGQNHHDLRLLPVVQRYVTRTVICSLSDLRPLSETGQCPSKELVSPTNKRGGRRIRSSVVDPLLIIAD